MFKSLLILVFFTMLTIQGLAYSDNSIKSNILPPVKAANTESGQVIKLPPPILKGQVSLEEALTARRSIRQYADAPLTLEQVSQILWAAQGVTSPDGKRTAPSAIAIYPLQVYLIAGKVDNLASGLYKYNPNGHELSKLKDGDLRADLSTASMSQASIRGAAVNIIITGDMAKMVKKAGEGSEKWVYIEAGHAAQNLCLEATALNLGTVTVGGIKPDILRQALGIPAEEAPIYILPVGKKK